MTIPIPQDLVQPHPYPTKYPEPMPPGEIDPRSLNAGRHHISTQVYLLPPGERATFNKIHDDLKIDLRPEGAEETHLVFHIADCHARLHRIHALESNIYALRYGLYETEPLAHGNPQVDYAIKAARHYQNDPMVFDRLSLYESRVTRTLERHRKSLRELQTERKAKRAQAYDEALLLYTYAIENNEEFDFEAEARHNGGFVFSAADFNERRKRQERLELIRSKQKPTPKLAFAA